MAPSRTRAGRGREVEGTGDAARGVVARAKLRAPFPRKSLFRDDDVEGHVDDVDDVDDADGGRKGEEGRSA
jgi:hypothetical protein